MNSVTFPSYVAAIARRILDAVSTLSISGHYYALQEERLRSRSSLLGGGTKGRVQDSRVPFLDPLDTSVLISTVPIPLLSRNRWPSIFSSIGQQQDTCLPPHLPMRTPKCVNQSPRPSKKPSTETPEQTSLPDYSPDIIHQLMMNPALLDPLRTPRYPIVLCHGLYGFDARGPTTFPSLRMHYWANALQFLRGTIGAEVIVTSVPGTGNITSRSARLDEQLQSKARGRGVNFLAHSMGGLDCRHLITHRQPTEYTPLSLTSVSTPHRGSPFMDWCAENIGIGKLRQHERQLLYGRADSQSEEDQIYGNHSASPDQDAGNEQPGSAGNASSKFNLTSLPSSFTTLLLSTVDSPAYANLTSAYLNEVFNPATPDDPKVKYFSVAGRAGSVGILHPFWFTKMVVDGVEEKERTRLAAESLASGGNWLNPQSHSPPVWVDERQWGNDGLVTVQSAKWGEFLGILDNCDHWEMRGARGLEFGVDLPAIPAIGLGSAPLLTSIGRGRTTTPSAASSSSRSKEAWYNREWTRFSGGWKRDEKDRVGGVGSSATATASGSQYGLPRVESSSTPSEQERDETKRQRQREFTKGDQVVRSSTDRLSLVFDWLVDQIPHPQVLGGVGTLPATPPQGKEKETNDYQRTLDDSRRLSAEMVAHMVAGGSSSPSSSRTEHGASHPLSLTPDAKPETLTTEVKKMMERERKRWKKNELATKDDLEKFYVALSRKMWDAGL